MSETESSRRPSLRIAVVGHVDHGKSTLIGRLLHETGSLPEGKLAELEAYSRRRGVPLEWSFALDSFQAERDQAITIDTTQIPLRTARRDYIIIDAPGHKEFLKNMISGAAQADAAVLVIDSGEGVSEQSRRHAYLLQLLGLRQVVVAVNKMDVAGYRQDRFDAVRDEMLRYLKDIGLVPHHVVPIAARTGENLATRAPAMAWYSGPTLLEALDALMPAPAPTELPLRLPVQNVYRFDSRRIVAGRIESGMLRVGDTLIFSPGDKTARIKTIETWPEGQAPADARAGQPVGITLDQPIFVERGDVASHATRPPILTHVFRARLFWLGRTKLTVGATLRLKLATRVAPASIQSIDRIIDTDNLTGHESDAVAGNEIAEVTLRSPSLLALDEYQTNPTLGRFVLIDGYDTVGAGIVNMKGLPDERGTAAGTDKNLFATEHLLDSESRGRRNGHRGAVVWFTGLSGAGKSTLAMEVEKRLYLKGYQVYVLDGDNVRRGLNADLGFTPADRLENIRRIGEMAALFADAGMIVITAFISPYVSDRGRARQAAKGAFHEVYIKADVATCETRDPKGLYKRARAGDIANFTGISAPYEEPTSPELLIDTTRHPVEESVRTILDYIERKIVLKTARPAE
ncbi:MAG TPA: adenylyl-sulfate kinase [Stellaceae bacterium]|nr:adenylyl-sulfate kinase [Stellaceae bacterium]